jgi:hypothetical protein
VLFASALSLLLVLGIVPAASAATTFYVSPTGSGNECTVAKPCNIVFALGSAASGDTVIVNGNEGSYGLPMNPTLEVFQVPGGVTMEGAPGQPRPVLYAAGVNHAIRLGSGANLVSFDIHYSAFGEALITQGDNTVERVIADAAGGGAGCLVSPEVTIVDSVCTGGYGLYEFVGGGGNWPITLRNDTIYAQTWGLGLGSNGPALTVTATNTIIHGGSEDIFAIDQGGGGHVSVVLSHSNYAKVKTEAGASVTAPGSGTNQTAAPLFANAAAGDFHELTGSPTIDAGANEAANGPLDLDGAQRALPARIVCGASEPAITDIGAFEFVPIAPSCPPPAGSGGPGSSGGSPPSPPPNANSPSAPETKISKAKIEGDTAAFRFSGSGVGPLRFECRLDKRKYRSCRSPKTYRNLKPGRHRFRVRAVGAGGTDSSPATRAFRIDT